MGRERHPGFRLNLVQQPVIEGGYAVVVEFGGDGAVHGHLLRRDFKGVAVALHLFADIAYGIFAAALLEFIDHHDIGKIEHVDFFKLRGGAEFGGHDIHGNVRQVDDLGIALTDPGGFGNDQVEPGGLGDLNDVGQGLGDFGMRPAGGQRAHVHPFTADGIHADAVAQKGAAGFAAGGIGTDDGHPDIGQVVQHALNQFISEG